MHVQTSDIPGENVRYLLPLIGLLAAFPPISTSMYLPAIPHLQELWGVPLKTINLTLIAFYLSYSATLLFYGPLSDRFGRRPPLMAGIGIFILGTLACATADSATHLIMGRIGQGMGAAGPSALGLSIIKDRFSGGDQKRILALMGILIPMASMVGPSLGSAVLFTGHWEMIFIVQVLVALAALVGVIRLPEPLAQKEAIPLARMAGPYLTLVKNRRFFSLNILFAASMWPFFAFIAASSDIYITEFGLSEQIYGIYFGANSLGMMLGSFVCMRIKNVQDMTMIRLGLVGVILGGVLLYVIPHAHPLSFTLPMFFITFCFGITRPFSVSLVLNSVDRHAGSASSLMMFANFIFGSMATHTISLGWSNTMGVIGILAMVSGSLILAILTLMGEGRDAPA
ncbi:MAG: multidrug effflux MFS transporter [Desulfobacterales bacterium]|nr:multidrug effflux MFS transporter [Desulfobacterales bacterium]